MGKVFLGVRFLLASLVTSFIYKLTDYCTWYAKKNTRHDWAQFRFNAATSDVVTAESQTACKGGYVGFSNGLR